MTILSYMKYDEVKKTHLLLFQNTMKAEVKNTKISKLKEQKE